MRRSCLLFVLLLLAASTVPAQQPTAATPEALDRARSIVRAYEEAAAAATERIRPLDMKFGQVGVFPKNDNVNYFEVIQILGTESMMVQYVARARKTASHLFFVIEVPTRGLVTDGKVDLSGRIFEIGTKKYKTEGGDERTAFAAAPYALPYQTEYESAKKVVVAADRAAAAAAATERYREENLKKQAAEQKKADEKPAKDEAAATAKLKLCKILLEDRKFESAIFRLNELVRQYPKTAGAKEAGMILKDPLHYKP